MPVDPTRFLVSFLPVTHRRLQRNGRWPAPPALERLYDTRVTPELCSEIIIRTPSRFACVELFAFMLRP